MKGNKCKLCKDKSPGLLMAWNPGKEVVTHTENELERDFTATIHPLRRAYQSILEKGFEMGSISDCSHQSILEKGFKMGSISDCSIIMISFVVFYVFSMNVISLSFIPLLISKMIKKKIVKGLDLLDYCVYAWKHDDRLTLISVVILTGRPSTLMLAGNCPYKMNKANVCFK